MNIDKEIVVFLNRFQSKPLDKLSEAISNIKVLSFLWMLVIAFVAGLDLQLGIDLLWKLILVFAVHYLVSELMLKYGAKKLSLLRQRPFVAFPQEVKAIGHNFSDSSFPSSHMASVTGGLIVLYASFPAMWPGLVLFAVALGFSRLHNGMHYPSDVLAGIVLGLLYGYIALTISVMI